MLHTVTRHTCRHAQHPPPTPRPYSHPNTHCVTKGWPNRYAASCTQTHCTIYYHKWPHKKWSRIYPLWAQWLDFLKNKHRQLKGLYFSLFCTKRLLLFSFVLPLIHLGSLFCQCFFVYLLIIQTTLFSLHWLKSEQNELINCIYQINQISWRWSV